MPEFLAMLKLVMVLILIILEEGSSASCYNRELVDGDQS
mgnify:CR=1 FL=1